jgi:hypothetical protein
MQDRLWHQHCDKKEEHPTPRHGGWRQENSVPCAAGEEGVYESTLQGTAAAMRDAHYAAEDV